MKYLVRVDSPVCAGDVLSYWRTLRPRVIGSPPSWPAAIAVASVSQDAKGAIHAQQRDAGMATETEIADRAGVRPQTSHFQAFVYKGLQRCFWLRWVLVPKCRFRP